MGMVGIDKEQERVSIIIPCYNYGQYVYSAIESVLSQDYKFFKLIVVDDGSTDNSVSEVERAFSEWRGKVSNEFILIKQSNQGVSAALNTGLDHAQGEYIVTFDADDVMAPGRLSLQVNYLDQHPEVGCIGGRFVRINQFGATLPKKHRIEAIERYDFYRAFASGLVVGGGLAAYRHDVMRLVGGYDQEIKIQDFQITLKIAYAGYYIDMLPDVVTYYRKHDRGLSSFYKDELNYGLQVVDAYKNMYGYKEARKNIIVKALKIAVIDDKPYAWGLLKKIPPSQWDRTVFKRFRHLVFKRKNG